MCLSIALSRPDDVLAKGEHSGLEWMVVHNGSGYRCGYVRVPAGHPWHGRHYDDVPADVHGGLTFGEPDKPCHKGGADEAYWFGFDCAHAFDGPDPSLPVSSRFSLASHGVEHVWTQEEVEAECRSLCEQAAKAASPLAIAVGGPL